MFEFIKIGYFSVEAVDHVRIRDRGLVRILGPNVDLDRVQFHPGFN